MVDARFQFHFFPASLVFSGALVGIHTIAAAQPQGGRDIAIRAVAAIGDVDGDAVSDLVAFEAGNTDSELVVRSGRDGHVVRRVPCSATLIQLVSAGDLDHDDSADFLAFHWEDVTLAEGSLVSIRDLASQRGKLELVSGRTAERCVVLEHLGPEGFGRSMTVLRSRTNGEPLVAIGAPGSVFFEGPPYVSIVSVPSGREVQRLASPAKPDQRSWRDEFGTSLASVADPNRGRRLLVGAPGRAGGRGAVDAFACDGFELVWSAEGPDPERGLGRTILEVGDVDGDGIGDAVAAAVHFKVVLLSGADGRTLWKRMGPWNGTRVDGWGDSLALFTDRDGDGYRDLAVGHFEGWDELDGDGVAILSIRTGELLEELAKGEQTLVAGPAVGPFATDARLIVAHPFTGVIHQFAGQRGSPVFTVSR
jgi:hypothetical protein